MSVLIIVVCRKKSESVCERNMCECLSACVNHDRMKRGRWGQ